MGTSRLCRVRKSFRHWQAKHGSGTGYHIPRKMKERAVELLAEHPSDKVTLELGLGVGTLNRWQRIYSMPKKRTKVSKARKAPEFVEVKGVAASVFSPEMVLEWVRRDGNRMRLTGASVASSREFIKTFLASEGT